MFFNRYFIYLCFAISSAIIVGGFFCLPVDAAIQDVMITEFMYDPSGSDTNHEWVELYNAGDNAVLLSGGSGADAIRLFDGANHVLATSTILNPAAYLVIARDTTQFLKDYPTFQGAVLESSFILDNSAGQLGLRIGTSGALWSHISYTSSWGASGNGFTLSKQNPLDVDTLAEWLQSKALGGSPGASNTGINSIDSSTTSTTPITSPQTTVFPLNPSNSTSVSPSTDSLFPSQLIINEIYSNPRAGEKEWIELYNPSESIIDLAGWKITDNTATTTLYGSIASHRFIFWEFKSMLNNDGDIITILRPDGSIADQIIYGDWRGSSLPAPESGQSLARFPDGTSTGNPAYDIFLTTTPTQAGVNKIFVPLERVSQTRAETHTKSQLSPNGLVFSEVFANPIGPDDQMQGEFLELINQATSTVDMSGWQIEIGEQTYRIASGTIVGALQFILLYRDITHIFLPNEKGVISLLNAQGVVIDRVKYENARAGISINRTGKEEWKWSTAVTPSKENRIIVPNRPPEPVMSIEGNLFPGNQLWFDASDSWDPDDDQLSYMWIFSDGVRTQGKWITRTFGDTKNYRVTLVVTDSFHNARAVSHQLKMNETYEDSIQTLQSETSATSTDIENIAYKEVQPDSPVISQRVSTTLRNQSLIVTTLAGAAALQLGVKVSLQGVVVAEPGIFGAQTIYIAEIDDLTSAIQLYMHTKKWPSLKRGDFVQVEGEIGKAYSQTRVKIKQTQNINIIRHISAVETPFISIAEVPITDLAAFVRIEGVVTDHVSGGFALADDSGEIALGIARGTGLPKGLVQVGDKARITGISIPVKNGMQILPRDEHDVEIIELGTTRDPGSSEFALDSMFVWLMVTLLGLGSVGGAWWYRRRSI